MVSPVTVLNEAKMSSKKGQFFRAIFAVKNYYGELDKCVRKFLSLVPNVSDNFPVSYGQNKIKKTTEKFTTEIFLCFDVHVHVNFGFPNSRGHGHQNIGTFQ